MLGMGSSHLYKQVYADDTLTEAWRHVRTGTDQTGVDGVTVVQFQARLFANLKTLQTTLRQRRYHPQPVKRLSIPKPDGTMRPLGILTVGDRIVQRAVFLTIEPLFDAGFEECSHGFRKGRSIHTALDQVVRLINHGYGWVVDLDIASCFDRINTGLLFTCIKDQLKDAELRRIIWAWLEAETVAVERQGLLRKREARGLLQGGILSPLFANVYLDRFDKMALKQGLKLVRYADDCLFCCRSQAEAEATLGAAHKFLARLDLEVNPRKTAIYHAEKGLYYLGERLMLKKRGPYEELVHVRRAHPGKAAPPLALPAATEPTTTQEEQWEPSTSSNKVPSSRGPGSVS
jgi:RNA-directed DNA polymerase